MNLQVDDNGFQYFLTLEAVKPEYKVVPVWNVLQFYRLKGRKTVMSADNLEPIPDLNYVIFSPQEKRYYLKQSRNWSLNRSYFYKKDLDFLGEDEAVLELQRRISDGNVSLLLTSSQVEDTTAMLQRLYKSHFTGEGKVPYKRWLELLDHSLSLEDYQDYGKSLLGFKTVCAQYNRKIQKIWEDVYEFNKK